MPGKEPLPSYFHPLYSAQDISSRVSDLGTEITAWAREVWTSSHTDIITIPVLRGGIFFFADLVRAIDHSVELIPTSTSSYQDGVNNIQKDEVGVDLSAIPARGRSLLLIDDICDSGRTLQVLTDKLREMGAAEVRSAVLVKRKLDRQTFSPEWFGFEFPGDEWLVGYGMDDCNRWRNLPAIYTIRKSVE